MVVGEFEIRLDRLESRGMSSRSLWTIVLTSIFGYIAFMYLWAHYGPGESPTTLAELGDAAGILNPIISLLAFVVLWFSFSLQAKEFREVQSVLRRQSEELKREVRLQSVATWQPLLDKTLSRAAAESGPARVPPTMASDLVSKLKSLALAQNREREAGAAVGLAVSKAAQSWAFTPAPTYLGLDVWERAAQVLESAMGDDPDDDSHPLLVHFWSVLPSYMQVLLKYTWGPILAAAGYRSLGRLCVWGGGAPSEEAAADPFSEQARLFSEARSEIASGDFDELVKKVVNIVGASGFATMLKSEPSNNSAEVEDLDERIAEIVESTSWPPRTESRRTPPTALWT